MELSHLCQLPQSPGKWHQFGHHLLHVLWERSLRTVVATANHAEDLVNGWVGWQCAVEDRKLPFETLRDVVASSAWLNHGSQELKQHNN